MDNNHVKKVRVAVLYGGRSGEHEVSLMSAANVIENLDKDQFEVVPIGIDKEGAWHVGDAVFRRGLSDTSRLPRLNAQPNQLLFDPSAIGKSLSISAEGGSHNVFDVIFPVIHGPLCEDGTVQGFLELTGLPYVGCGVLASALGMDKDVSKRLVVHAGIATPAYVALSRSAWHRHTERCLEQVEAALTYPVFVKPANTGSSVGISKAKTRKQLLDAVEAAFQYDHKIVIEQGLNAREIEVAVLESLEYGADPIVSIPGEVRPTARYEFYSYASKYLDEAGADLIIPATLSDETVARIQAIAKDIFQVLGCEGMARVDLFLDDATGNIYFNEINSLPGFTSISMYPKLMMASGLSYQDLLTHLVQLAMDRNIRKSQLSRDYVEKTTTTV
nr:L,D-transpeptidase catalytic domain protein [uncultured bacterium]